MSNRNCIFVLVLLTFTIARLPAAEPPVTALEFSPDGKSVLVGSQAGIEIRSWPDLKRTGQLETELPHINALQFSPDKKLLGVAGGEPAQSGQIEVFNWPGGKRILGKSIHDDLIYGIDWHTDSNRIATASLDRIVSVFDVRSGKVTTRFTKHSRGVTSVSFLQRTDLVVSAGMDQSLRVWNASDGQLLRTLDNHTRPIHAVAVRPADDSTELPIIASVSDDRTVRVWQPTIGRMVRFARLPAVPLDLKWSLDGRWIVASCDDGHVRVIDPDSVTIVRDVAALAGWAYCLAIHPNKHGIAVGGVRGKVKRLSLPDA